MLTKLLKFLLLSICLLTAACGFHLRGSIPLPPALHFIYLETHHPYSSFTKQLKRALCGSGVQLVPDARGAPITLQILDDTFIQTTTGIGTSGQTTTYILTYSVSFQIMDCNGRIIQPPQTVSTTRNYSISSNELLSGINVLSHFQDEMQRDCIFQLLNHLRAPCTLIALQQT